MTLWVQVFEYEAHERRVWGVDFSPAAHHTFATGSDDGLVKVGARRGTSREWSYVWSSVGALLHIPLGFWARLGWPST